MQCVQSKRLPLMLEIVECSFELHSIRVYCVLRVFVCHNRVLRAAIICWCRWSATHSNALGKCGAGAFIQREYTLYVCLCVHVFVLFGSALWAVEEYSVGIVPGMPCWLKGESKKIIDIFTIHQDWFQFAYSICNGWNLWHTHTQKSHTIKFVICIHRLSKSIIKSCN